MGELIPLENIGNGGIITDIPPWQLDMGVWSGGNNVRFDDRSVKKAPGYLECLDTVPVAPRYLETYQVYDSGQYYWLSFGETTIHCYYGGSWADVTPTSGLTFDSRRQWQTTKLGAVLVATNGVDMPLWWPLEDGKPSHTRLFETLPNWADQNWISAQTMAGFKSFLFAGAVYDEAEDKRMNRQIVWSDMTNQYTPPASWDFLDPDGDAGMYELLDSEGPVVHVQQLRESLMIYKTDSVVVANFVGAPFMFSFQVLSPEIGIMCKNAVAEFPGGHFFMGRSDCYVNNGQIVTPILTQKIKTQIYENIDGDAFNQSFVVTDWANNEVWACYPTVNSEHCDTALIWNFVNNTFTIRDLPQVSHIKAGIAQYLPGDDQWDSQTYEWDNTTRKWGTASYDNVVENLVLASTGDVKTYRTNAGNTEDGTLMTSYVERTGIDLGDPSSVKFVSAIWPKVWTTGSDTVLKVWLASQMSTEESVTWEGPVLFNPNIMSKISVRTSAKLFGIKFESDGDFDWGVSGIEYEVVPSGRRGSRVYV
jgi:hypothetical protein